MLIKCVQKHIVSRFDVFEFAYSRTFYHIKYPNTGNGHR